MNRQTIKNTVSLFLHCQKLIANPKRLHFSELKSLLNSVIDEEEFNNIVKSIFNLSDHYFLLEKYRHPTSLLVDINQLADQVKLIMNPNQKLIFITILFKLMKVNNQEKNSNLERAIYCVAEIFSFSQDQTRKIGKLFTCDEPAPEDYHDSILLTNEAPDYIQVIEGLKVIYNPGFKFRIWVRNVKSVNNMLFKIIEFHQIDTLLGIKAGDVLTYNRGVQSLLNQNNISMIDLTSKIISATGILSRVEIAATERSPAIVLNAEEKRMEIEGISMTLQPQNFFEPVFYWLEKMKKNKPDELAIHINLSFFNTYTSKVILSIFQKILEFEQLGCKPKYYWYYEEEDDELKEAGEHYSSIINRDFIYVSKVPSNLECA